MRQVVSRPWHRSQPFAFAASLLLGFLGSIGLSDARADLPHAQLTTIFPPGGKVGTAVEVTITGAELDDADRLIFSHPGITATPKMTAQTEFEKPRVIGNAFTVQIAGDVPPGSYDVRVASRFGLSNPRAFVVGQKDEVVEAGGNNQADKAMELPLNTVLNGRADGSNVDYYQLKLTAGQRVFIECWAQRIDSRMDATLVLTDATGRELVRNRDTIYRDPLIDFTAPAEGTYLVRVFDYLYAGGGEHFYRLVAHLGPYVDAILPPAGLPGSTGQYTILGRALPGGQPAEGLSLFGRPLEKLSVTITLPGDPAQSQALSVPDLLQLSAAWENSFGYQFAPGIQLPIYYATSPVVLEQEPNNTPAQAQKVTLPCEVAGQFYPNRDEDWVAFDAKAGESYIIEVIAQRTGQRCDPFLQIQRVNRNDKGEESVAQVAQLDDPGDRAGRIGGDFDTTSDDPSYRLDVPSDGTYRVMVRDQFGASTKDPRLVYRLAIRRPQPDFKLVATPQPVQAPANPNLVQLGSISLRKGGTANVDVQVRRLDGFTGEIEISAEGLPAGITCNGATLAGDMQQVPLVFSAAEDAARWEGTIQIVGKAKLADQEIARHARSAAIVWGSGNKQQQAASYRLARGVNLAVMGLELDLAMVQAGPGTVLETSKGGKLDIPLKVVRRGDFKADLTLAPVGLPNELKPQNVAVKGDQAEAVLPFAATNANAKPGTYTFVVRADVKVKHVRNPEAQAAAEEEQKSVDAKMKEFTEANQKATQAKDAATKAAQDATAAMAQAQQNKTNAETAAKQAAEAAVKAAEVAAAAKQQADNNAGNQDLANAAAAAEKAKAEADTKNTAAAETLVAANKAFEEAQAKLKEATEQKAAAEKTATEADAKLKAAQQAKTVIDKRLDDIKKANAPKDIDTAFISTPVKVRIVDSPIQLTVPAPGAPVTQGQKLDVPLTVNRAYGFDGPIEVSFEPPQGVAGLQANKLSIPKDQTEGKFELAAAANATPGDHSVTVRAKGQFNGVNVETVTKVPLKVAAAPK